MPEAITENGLEKNGLEKNGLEKTARLSRDELSEGWADVGRVPRVTATVKMGAKTDLGRVRDNNEDKFDFFEPEDPQTLALKGCFYAVADGMGGHSAGQIACELALKTVMAVYYAEPAADRDSCLRQAVREANSLIFDTAAAIPDRQGMGTTLTAAVLCEDTLTIAQVGDSRAYLLRGGQISQVTEDHSWVAEQVRLGAMTLAEAQTSPFRNIITRSVGTAATVEPDLFTQTVLAGDILVFCSDGLTGHVEASEIQAIALENSPSAAAALLIETANERGGRDNITALVLAIRSVTPYAGADPKDLSKDLLKEPSKDEKPSRWGRRK